MAGTLILVRHGQSLWNKDNLFCGWVDIKLSDEGRKQARYSAKLIQDSGISAPDICFTSRLTRAIETTNIILEDLDLQYIDLVKSFRLNERHYGKLQGEAKNDILNKYGEEKYMLWRRAYEGCPPLSEPQDKYYCIDDKRYSEEDPSELPRGESLKMVLSRLLPFYKSHIEPKLSEGKTVLVVSHGSVVRALTKHLYNIDDETISGINIPNGIPMAIRLDENLKPDHAEFAYLDPETAKIEAAKVARQGFEKRDVTHS